MVKEKILKAIGNLCQLSLQLESKNKRELIGDLDYIISNCQKAQYLLQAQLEEEKNEKSNQQLL